MYPYSSENIQIVKENCQILSNIFYEIKKIIKPGITTLHLEALTKCLIKENKAEPAFLNYKIKDDQIPFPYTTCISLNEEVVHGIPSTRTLKSGDILKFDCGIKKNNLYADSAFTFPVGKIHPTTQKLLEITQQILNETINQLKPPNTINNISTFIWSYARKYNLNPANGICGHGIGYNLHELPQIPNKPEKNLTNTQIQNGMILALEPIINLGSEEITLMNDNWTFKTKDHKPSAHFEHTIAIINEKPEILTKFP
jgi:methionyl aminopeptidase